MHCLSVIIGTNLLFFFDGVLCGQDGQGNEGLFFVCWPDDVGRDLVVWF